MPLLALLFPVALAALPPWLAVDRDVGAAALAPPIEVLGDRLVVELRAGEQTDVALKWDVRALTPRTQLVMVAGFGLAVQRATLDGREAALAGVGGADATSLPDAPGAGGLVGGVGVRGLVARFDGRHRFELTGVLATPDAQAKLLLPPAARQEIVVVAPGMDVDVAGAVRLGGGRFALAEATEAVVTWRPAAPPPPRPTVVAGEVSAALRVDEVGVEGRASLRYRVRQGSVETVAFRLGAQVTDLTVAGDGVASWARQGDRIAVRLADTVRDAVALDVSWRAASDGAAAAIPMPEVAQPSGWVSVLRSDEATVIPSARGGLESVSPRALPERARGLVEGASVASYRVTGAAPDLAVRVLRSVPLEGPPTVVDEARYEVAYADHGSYLLVARLQVRNDRSPYLRVSPPPGARPIGARVAGRTVPLSTDGGDGVLVPLEKSVETLQGLIQYPVEIAFFGEDEAWGRRGARTVEAPALSAPVAQCSWELWLPPGLDAALEDGSATLAPVGPTASLAYGRAGVARKKTMVFEEAAIEVRPQSDTLVAASQEVWNEAYHAYKENRFDEAGAYLDEALRLDPDNQAASALLENVNLLTSADGEDVTGEEEAQARRVREMARAKTARDEVEQEKLLEKAQSSAAAGDLDEAEAAYAAAVEITSRLAQVEQVESVEQKVLLAQSSGALAAVRDKKKSRSSDNSRSSVYGLDLAAGDDDAPDTGISALLGLGARGSGSGGGGSAEGYGAGLGNRKIDDSEVALDNVSTVARGASGSTSSGSLLSFEVNGYTPPEELATIGYLYDDPAPPDSDADGVPDDANELYAFEDFIVDGVEGGVEGGIVGGVIGGAYGASLGGEAAPEPEPEPEPPTVYFQRTEADFDAPVVDSTREAESRARVVVQSEALERVPAGRNYRAAAGKGDAASVSRPTTRTPSSKPVAPAKPADARSSAGRGPAPAQPAATPGLLDPLVGVTAATVIPALPHAGTPLRLEQQLLAADEHPTASLEWTPSRRSSR